MSNLVPVIELKVPGRARQMLVPNVRGMSGQIQAFMVPRMKRAMEAYLSDVVTKTLQDMALHDRSGNMRKQLKRGVRVYGSGTVDSVRGAVVADPYVSLHEYGGKVKPKGAKALTVPLRAALRPDGTPKRRRAGSWKPFGTYIWKSKETGNAYIVYNRKNKSRVFLYVLIHEANFKKKLGMRRHANKLMPGLVRAFGNIMLEAMTHVDLAAIAFRSRRVRANVSFRPTYL